VIHFSFIIIQHFKSGKHISMLHQTKIEHVHSNSLYHRVEREYRTKLVARRNALTMTCGCTPSSMNGLHCLRNSPASRTTLVVPSPTLYNMPHKQSHHHC